MPNTKFKVLQSGSTTSITALHVLQSGAATAIKQLVELSGGVAVLVEDWTTPSAPPSGVSIALVERPGSSHAGVSWTAVSATSDSRFWYDVVITWYRNGVATTTHQVNQSVGSDSSPSSTTWAVGDVVKADLNYKNRRNGSAVSSTTTTGTVTLDAGI